MGLFLLVATLGLEALGLAFSYWYGWAVVAHIVGNGPLASGAGWFCVAMNLFLHIGFAVKQASGITRMQLRLARPSERQQQTVLQVYDQIRSSHYRPQRPIKVPRSFLFSPNPDFLVGWTGTALTIRDILIKSQYLFPLLARELAHYNSSDVWLRFVLALFPPAILGMGAICGIGAGLGPLLLSPVWASYWRDREYAADAFVARLGYAESLIEALEQTTLPRNREQTLVSREIPYTEERIDRLRQFQY